MKVPAARWVGYPAAVVVVLATIGLLKLFPQLTVSSIALLLLLAVFLCASVWQSGPGVLAAVLSTHALVVIPSTVSTHSWNLIFVSAAAAGAYAMQSQEAFALDTRLNPPPSGP